METKRCTKCGTEYPRTPEYFQRQKGPKDGLHSWCKPCKRADSRIRNKDYYVRNRDKLLAQTKLYTNAHPEAQRQRHHKWYVHHKELSNARSAANLRKIREETLAAYGGKCECCGEDHYEFLAIDHINGGGNKHRRAIGTSISMARWLRDSGYPDGFRILCHNCNMAIGFYGRCPHQTSTPP
jgi:hypothetical protein